MAEREQEQNPHGQYQEAYDNFVAEVLSGPLSQIVSQIDGIGQTLSSLNNQLASQEERANEL